MTLSERIQAIVDDLYDGSWNKLAKDIGVNASTLQRVKEGGGMRSESILHFCENLNLNANWLLTGEGGKYNYRKMTVGSLMLKAAEESDPGALRVARAWNESEIQKDDDFKDPYFLTLEEIEQKAIEGNKSANKFMNAYDRDWFRFTPEYEQAEDEYLSNESMNDDLGANIPKELFADFVPPAKLSDEQTENLRQLGTPPIEDFIQVPVYDIQASAGPGVLVESEEQKAVINFSPYYLSSLGVPSSKAAIIYVKGDSMLGTLDPETPILVDTGIQSMQQDGIYVIRIGDTLHVKRIQRQLDGSLKIISDNKVYEPYVISGADLDQVQIVGRVVLSVQLF